MNLTCPDCLKAAIDPNHGGYHADCNQCNIRGIAMSPKFIREHHYGMVLAKDGKEAMEARKRLVSAEWGRIQRLRNRED